MGGVRVSSQNATEKMSMYEMLLIYVFGGWGFGVGACIFCIEVLGNAFCHWRFVPRSDNRHGKDSDAFR